MSDRIPVLVTTAHRAVVFGYIDPNDRKADEFDIFDVRFCVYWSVDLKGLLGLCTKGPSSACKIGPTVKQAYLKGITGVFAMTPEAIKAWDKAPWG